MNIGTQKKKNILLKSDSKNKIHAGFTDIVFLQIKIQSNSPRRAGNHVVDYKIRWEDKNLFCQFLLENESLF